MMTLKDKSDFRSEARPVKRGLRYYLFMLLLLAWGIFFLLAASSALTSLSLLAVLASGLLLYLGFVMRNVYRSLNPVRSIVHFDPLKELGLDFKDVSFPSRDGVMLSGWFMPSRNGGTVVLTHGIGGNRLDVMPATKVLVEQGFGVLLYDLRAHGRSTGNLGTWGWVEVNDFHGAVDYLLSHSDVDPYRIGAMGFSLGGQITIRAAAENGSVRAVIAEDPSPAVLSDHPMPSGYSWRKLYNYPGLWLVYHLQSAASGVSPPEGVLDSIVKLSPRPILMISSGKGRGQDLLRTYFNAADQPKELWEVPEARHGWVFAKRPLSYQEKVTRFFNRWLLGESDIEFT
jgi:pimeloyl-ACP methyl ester carboxylesterase